MVSSDSGAQMDPEKLFTTLIVALAYVALAAAPFVFLWMGWHWLSRTLLREERARCFLGLLDLGLQQGQAPEQVVVSMAAGRVSELGADLSLLSSAIQRG